MAALAVFVTIVTAYCSFSSAATCLDPPYNTYLYCNYNASIEDRVKDLVKRMSAKDKISQLGTGAESIDDLAVPSYQWWSEGLHGVAGSPGVHFGGKLHNATSFPQVIGLGATFNISLIRAMAEVISTEARAFANQQQAGLTYFAPNINIYRDPRWGRGQETPGEDPYLTSQYVVQFLKGMQEGEDPRYLKTVPTCKHFAAYNLESFGKINRHAFNAIVSDQDLVETYLPAFEACVRDGQASSIMCSYNAINGVPSCANDLINNEIARKEWGFEGYIVSDCGAITNIMTDHHYTNTTEDTMRAGLRGGCDLDCGGFYQKNGMDAYSKGTINDDDLDLAMTRLFTYRMKLGMFDPTSMQPYMSYPTSVVNTEYNQNLALQAAEEGIVLLQNDGTLPLSLTQHHNIALIGPNADATTTMQGNYHGTAPFLISPLMGLQNLNLSVTYVQGCDVPCTSTSGFVAATDAAKKADVIIIVIGLDGRQENEAHDRTEISLPGNQEMLLQNVKKAAENKPFIVVLMSGGPVDISSAKTMANGILWTGYPGQAGGTALAKILYGQVNPSGKLPMTFYPANYVNEISYGDMGMRTSPGRTYKFYNGTPVFAFGDGLSYTQFKMEWTTDKKDLYISHHQLTDDTPINYEVKVTNTGNMGGGLALLAFVTSDQPGAPLKELFGFQKIYLKPGEYTSVFFGAGPKVFSTVDETGKRDIRVGKFLIKIGDLDHTVVIQ